MESPMNSTMINENPNQHLPISDMISISIIDNELSMIAAADDIFDMGSMESISIANDQADGASEMPADQIQVDEIDQKSIVVRMNLNNTTSVAVCRICHSGEASCPFSNGEPLISPCHCRGSSGMYHRTCLERWLSTCNKEKCEICKYQYHVQRVPKSLCDFLINPGHGGIRRHVISDLICWLILTPTAAIGAWLCIASVIHRSEDLQSNAYDRDVQVPILIGLSVFLIVTYIIWSGICFRYHVVVFRRWRKRNYRIRVLDAGKVKTRRRSSKKSKQDLNNNEGFQMRRSVMNTPRDQNPSPTPRQTGSAGTNYSSPWLHIQEIPIHSRMHRQFETYSSPAFGPSAVFEPRPSVPLRYIDL